MLSYCLKCEKNTENIDPRISKTRMVKQCYFDNVLYVIVKNQDLLRNKKQMNY